MAAHWLYKREGEGRRRMGHLGQVAQGPRNRRTKIRASTWDARTDSLARGLRLHPEGRGQGAAGRRHSTDFAYAVHTDVGHRTAGQGERLIVPLHYRLTNGDFVEILTTKSGRAHHETARGRDSVPRAEQDPAVVPALTRGETEAKGRGAPRSGSQGSSSRTASSQGSSVLAQVISDTGFKKGRGTFLRRSRRGQASPQAMVKKVIHQLKTDEGVAEPIVTTKPPKAQVRSRATISSA